MATAGILKGKTAVVTGGSDGIGLAIAQGFAREGAQVLLIGRDQAKLEGACAQFDGLDGAAHGLAADLSEPSAIPGLVTRILDCSPQIDILVNNAGTARFTPFGQVGDDELDIHLNLNIKAPYRLTQGLLDSLEANKGCVINISSYFAERMLPGRPSTAYSLTKGALNAFTKALAFELGPRGVRVNAIAPGTVNTTLVQRNIEQLSGEGQQHFAEMIRTIYPLGRIGEPEDLAGIAVYLASEQARWVTGSIFHVDGGLTTNGHPQKVLNAQKPQRLIYQQVNTEPSTESAKAIRKQGQKWLGNSCSQKLLTLMTRNERFARKFTFFGEAYTVGYYWLICSLTYNLFKGLHADCFVE